MKKLPERIDLHMHSTVSDGTDTPSALVSKVREAGIELFSLTDHDAVEGVSAVRKQLQTQEDSLLLFIPGIEFSCQDDRGKYHILGYAYDDQAKAIHTLVKEAHDLRIRKLTERLDFIQDNFGFCFTPEDREALYRNSNPGKPHIANLMIRYGYASSIQEAMEQYLNKKKIPDAKVSPASAVRAILESGGIPVLAHPSFGDGGQLVLGEDMDRRLRYLLDFGLEGVECFYSGFPPGLTEEMLAFAEKYDLYVTAGSDYHGTNKMVKIGGSGLDAVSKGPKGLWRFLYRVL